MNKINNKIPLICPLCEKSFRYAFNLDKHIKKDHKDNKVTKDS